MRPRWDNRSEVILPSPVGVDIRLHVFALRPSLRNDFDRFGHLTPKTVVRNLQMNDLYGQLSPTPDFDRFPDRAEDADTFRAHMGGVDAPVVCDDLTHGDQRVRVNPGARWATQRACHAERSLLHRIPNELAH